MLPLDQQVILNFYTLIDLSTVLTNKIPRLTDIEMNLSNY